MEADSKEFRRDVLAAVDAGRGTGEVATLFGVSEAWVRRIKQVRREWGRVAAKTTRNRKHVWEDWSDWLQKKIDDRPAIYLRELQADLKAEHGVEVSQWTICKACRALRRTRKKRR